MKANERLRDRLFNQALKEILRAVAYVAETVYLEMGSTQEDRETYREMKKIYGRRLTRAEKHGVIAYRVGSELGRRGRFVAVVNDADPSDCGREQK